MDRHGGTETYVTTAAAALEGLGHAVTIFASEQGPAAELARSTGLTVVSDPEQLPEACGGVISSSADVALELAARYPLAPRLMVLHATTFVLFAPSALPGVVHGLVVLNDRVGRWARSTQAAEGVPVIRLRQPIETRERFRPRGTVGPRLRRIAAVGNYLDGDRLELLRAAADRVGAEVSLVGAMGTSTDTPEVEICKADAVVGLGRSAIEGMACGRPVYVTDREGCDGWVTRERYARIEAEGFAGLAFAERPSVESLARDFAAFDPQLGIDARELVQANHRADVHAAQLVAELERVAETGAAASPVDRAVLLEQARLHRGEWVARERLLALAHRLDGELQYSRRLQDEVADIDQRLRATTRILDTRPHRALEAALRPLGRWRHRGSA
ncbi:unannotated protein [freshwater metagenome]|uniref:Unannotated protein n=1 Tax=freshwater metagenome TaxID=449393 RepID=A0A6J7DS08_9ZZZZ